MGFTGLALGGMLFKDGVARAQNSGPGWRAPDGSHHAEPKAKSVIWIFLIGGASHLESFDVKPALNRHAGKTIDAAGYASALRYACAAGTRASLLRRAALPGLLTRPPLP